MAGRGDRDGTTTKVLFGWNTKRKRTASDRIPQTSNDTVHHCSNSTNVDLVTDSSVRSLLRSENSEGSPKSLPQPPNHISSDLRRAEDSNKNHTSTPKKTAIKHSNTKKGTDQMAEPPKKRAKRTDSSAMWEQNSFRSTDPDHKSRAKEEVIDRKDRRDDRDRQHGRDDRRRRSRSKERVEKRRDRSRSRNREKERDRERDKERDKEMDREKGRERDREKGRERGRESEREKDKNKDAVRGKSRSRERDSGRYRNGDRGDDREKRDRKRSTSRERHRPRRGNSIQ